MEKKKAAVIKKIKELEIAYEALSKEVSPKHWRATGSHFTEIRIMKEQIEKFTPITPAERELAWVQDQL